MADSPGEPDRSGVSRSRSTPKATRIDDKSITFRWLVPAALIVLSAAVIVLIAVVVAAVLGVFPGM